jgi:hypothetical protein
MFIPFLDWSGPAAIGGMGVTKGPDQEEKVSQMVIEFASRRVFYLIFPNG